MTTPRVQKIALVSDVSEPGDWAFDAALRMGRAQQTGLNIYYFLESPYTMPRDVPPARVEVGKYDEAALAAREIEVRTHFEDRLGDFVEVGFRVCESGRHNLELRRCLLRREYQLLIIPYPEYGAGFGNMPIEEFAYRFASPVMLVGPEHATQYHLNPFASLIQASLTLIYGGWSEVPAPADPQTLPVI